MRCRRGYASGGSIMDWHPWNKLMAWSWAVAGGGILACAAVLLGLLASDCVGRGFFRHDGRTRIGDCGGDRHVRLAVRRWDDAAAGPWGSAGRGGRASVGCLGEKGRRLAEVPGAGTTPILFAVSTVDLRRRELFARRSAASSGRIAPAAARPRIPGGTVNEHWK